MLKKPGLKRICSIYGLIFPLIFCTIYALLIFLLPQEEKRVHKIILAVLLILSSFHDIREQKIPVEIIAAFLCINVMHSVFVLNNLASWTFSLIFFCTADCSILYQQGIDRSG